MAKPVKAHPEIDTMAMDIEAQLQQLLHHAPQDGKTPQLLERAVIPVLRAYGAKMQHRDYYIMQNAQQRWVLTTLSNRATPQLEKKVVYGFSSPQDAVTFSGRGNPDLRPVALPIMQILFQLFAMKPVDSLVFFEQPGELSQGKEVKRQELEALVQQQLRQPPANFA
ncbi:hypothetical protein VB712_17740 [Spirulina sp. CCNP1310]|nr:hypothetical protein [Spirulina sp. CCNP1310]